MSLNSINQYFSIKEQRENLLELNNDLVYGIYEILENSDKKIVLKNMENILTCFPEKFEKLAWIKENPDILILDIKEFRAWNIKILNRKNPTNFYLENSNLTLLSSWVIEVIESEYKAENWEIKSRKHFPTTLRDNGTIWAWIRNSVAGRNSTSDLIWDIEREYSEESPYLWKDENWNFCLFTPERTDKETAISDLKGSVEFFLENKYLNENEENFSEVKKLFENSFRWKINYEDLWKILEEIIKNDRIKFFESKDLENFENIEWALDWIKEIQILWENGKIISSGNFFVNENKAVNTIEYMQFREIKLPDWIISPNWRLYLESQNQGSKNQRFESLEKTPILPVMKKFVEKVREKIKS